MKYNQSNIKIDRYVRDYIKICRGFSPAFINGKVILGGSVASGISFDNPRLRGFDLRLNVDTLEIDPTLNFDIEFSNFVHKNDGQKTLRPSFEPDGRCFVRGRSTGVAAPGESTVQNGIVEIDPDTGAMIGDIYNAGGGTNADYFEINTSDEMYYDEGNVDYIRVLDFDYNQLRRYPFGFDNFSSLGFAVNAKGDIAMVGGTIQKFVWYSKNKNETETFDVSEIPTAVGTQLVEVRMSNDTIFILDNSLTILTYKFREGIWGWTRSIGNFSTFTTAFDGSLYVGYGGSQQRIQKIDPETGNTLYTSDVVFDSLNLSPNIATIGQLSAEFLYAWASVLGDLRLLKDTGEEFILLDGVLGSTRGAIAIHPFQNDRIQNFSV